MKICSKVIKYGDHVDTDVIIPARYLNTGDPAELAAHCMEDLDSDFHEKSLSRHIIVAGRNFGCGSSREHAPPAAAAAIADGDEVEADLDAGVIRDLTTGETFTAAPFPPFVQKIIDCGGIEEYVKERIAGGEHQ